MMMKKKLFLTALLFICCGVLQVKAQNMPKKHLRQVVIDNLTYKINKDDATARVLGFGKEKVYNLVIPSKIKWTLNGNKSTILAVSKLLAVSMIITNKRKNSNG